MANRNTTQLGAPGPRPLGAPRTGGPQANGAGQHAPAGGTPLTLSTLREVRGELASLSEVLGRMSAELADLRRAVETLTASGGQAPGSDAPVGRSEAAKKARPANLGHRAERKD